MSAQGGMQAAPCTFSKMPVYCMTEDRQGRIWIGTKGEGVYLLTPEDGRRTRYGIRHLVHNGADKTSINSDSIYDIYQDRKGYIWLGSCGSGLCRTKAAGGDAAEFVTVRGGKGFNKIRDRKSVV